MDFFIHLNNYLVGIFISSFIAIVEECKIGLRGGTIYIY